MDDLCRLCKSKTELMNVFDPRIVNMKDVIKIASGIEILETDDISRKVCLQCCVFSVKVFHFHRKSSMINQQLMDVYNKRKQLKSSEIVLNKTGYIDNNNPKNNNVGRTTNVENRKNTLKFHTSILQMQKKYSNLKFPLLKPDSDYQPFITLLTNEVSDWYKKETPRTGMTFQVDENSVERLQTPQFAVCSSSKNKKDERNQAENHYSKKIEESKTNGILKQNKHEEILIEKKEVENSRIITKQNRCNRIEDKEAIIVKGKKQMECHTVENGASIQQIQNKDDLKRKKSSGEILSNKKTRNTEKYNVATVDKPKSGTQIQSQKETSENVSDRLTIQKQRDNNLHKINEIIETKKKEGNQSQCTIAQNNSNDIQCKTTELIQKKKNEIQKQSSTKEIENETSIQMNKIHNNVTQQRHHTAIKKHEVSSGQLIVNQSNSKRTQRNSDELLKQKKSKKDNILSREQQNMNKKLQEKATENEKDSRHTTENNSSKLEETHSKTAPKMANKNVTTGEKSSADVNAIQLKEASSKKRNADIIQSTQSSSPKKTRISKEVCQPSTTNSDEILHKECETSPKQKLVNQEQNNKTPKEPTNEKPEDAVINISSLRENLKVKFRGCSLLEKMQEVGDRNKQLKVLEENNINAVPSSLSNNSNGTNTLINIPNSDHNKIDFVKSLNLMPCSEKTEHEAYTNNEMLSVRFVKFCCKDCSASHSTLKSLKAHVKKYHSSCLFCSHHLENIDERMKHMLFYCPKRTIKVPKVVLIKVDKQTQIVSKYASSFLCLNSDHKRNISDPTQNTEKPTLLEIDTLTNLQSSETQGNHLVKSECDIPDHKPIFNIPLYNVTNTMNLRNLKELYNKVKNRTLYTLDSIVEDPINREYRLKKLSPELCFHKVNIALKHGKCIHIQFNRSKNLPCVTSKMDFWDNETVTCPLAITQNHQIERKTQEVPTQSDNMEITASSNNITNPMIFSRPSTAVSTIRQPNSLNRTNNMPSSLTPQVYYPFFVNGQSIVLIPQQQEQRNTPVALLQTSNNSAVILNRQTNILLNSSFQIPSAPVLPM